ncbi:MAG: NTP transferase domain-containing protein, partial [Rhodospirillales bacterium]|nr:NTP transferase domain-containing protein [Rhodospirillales bacterium]
MQLKPTAVIILAAGLGTRMKSDTPKVLHRLAGRPMILHLLDEVARLGPERVVLVIGPEMDAVAGAVSGHPAGAVTAVQEERLGTGHAARQALPHLHDYSGDILVLYGDSPLITADTMRRLLVARAADTDPGVVVLGFQASDPGDYGRLILGDADSLDRIVEAADAGPDELHTGLSNSGIFAVDGARFADWLAAIGSDNAKGEYYLTDMVGVSVAEGRQC